VLLEVVPVLLEPDDELALPELVLVVEPVLEVAVVVLAVLLLELETKLPPDEEDELGRRAEVVEVVMFATALLTLVATTGLLTERGAEGSFFTLLGTDLDILFIFNPFLATGFFLATAAANNLA